MRTKIKKVSTKLSKSNQLRANIAWGLEMLRRLGKKELYSKYLKTVPSKELYDRLSEDLRGAFESTPSIVPAHVVSDLIHAGEFQMIGKISSIKISPISVGLILTNGEKFLGVHPTNNKYWDIPKGMREPGEALINTCIREFKEECGIDIIRYKKFLTLLGTFPYTGRRLSIFILRAKKLPSISRLKCTSLTPKGFPEVDKWKYFTPKQIGFFEPVLARLLKKLNIWETLVL